MERFIARHIKLPQPDAMYDIGVGPKTEWRTLKVLYPAMRVFGCEPNPQMISRIQPFFTGQLLQAGIGREVGRRTLSFLPHDAGSGGFLQERKGDTKVEVDIVTLDDFDHWAGAQDNILLWMDIEGCELDALLSGPKLMESGRVKWINLEERKPGHEHPSPDWAKHEDIAHTLNLWDYVMVQGYNPHQHHWDVIYKHKSVL